MSLAKASFIVLGKFPEQKSPEGVKEIQETEMDFDNNNKEVKSVGKKRKREEDEHDVHTVARPAWKPDSLGRMKNAHDHICYFMRHVYECEGSFIPEDVIEEMGKSYTPTTSSYKWARNIVVTSLESHSLEDLIESTALSTYRYKNKKRKIGYEDSKLVEVEKKLPPIQVQRNGNNSPRVENNQASATVQAPLTIDFERQPVIESVPKKKTVEMEISERKVLLKKLENKILYEQVFQDAVKADPIISTFGIVRSAKLDDLESMRNQCNFLQSHISFLEKMQKKEEIMDENCISMWNTELGYLKAVKNRTVEEEKRMNYLSKVLVALENTKLQ